MAETLIVDELNLNDGTYGNVLYSFEGCEPYYGQSKRKADFYDYFQKKLKYDLYSIVKGGNIDLFQELIADKKSEITYVYVNGDKILTLLLAINELQFGIAGLLLDDPRTYAIEFSAQYITCIKDLINLGQFEAAIYLINKVHTYDVLYEGHKKVYILDNKIENAYIYAVLFGCFTSSFDINREIKKYLNFYRVHRKEAYLEILDILLSHFNKNEKSELMGFIDQAIQIIKESRLIEMFIKLATSIEVNIQYELDCGLVKACEDGDLDLVKCYLKWGSSPTFDDTLCLSKAVSNGHANVVSELLKLDQVSPKTIHLDYAVSKNYYSIVSSILNTCKERRIPIGYQKAFDIAIDKALSNIIDLLLESKGPNPASKSDRAIRNIFKKYKARMGSVYHKILLSLINEPSVNPFFDNYTMIKWLSVDVENRFINRDTKQRHIALIRAIAERKQAINELDKCDTATLVTFFKYTKAYDEVKKN